MCSTPCHSTAQRNTARGSRQAALPHPSHGIGVLPAALPADQPVGNYWINVGTLNGLNSPAILSYEGAPDPATDPAVSATAYAKNLGCASAAGGQPGVLDLKNASLAAGAGVAPPPQVRPAPPACKAATLRQKSFTLGFPPGQALVLSTHSDMQIP